MLPIKALNLPSLWKQRHILKKHLNSFTLLNFSVGPALVFYPSHQAHRPANCEAFLMISLCRQAGQSQPQFVELSPTHQCADPEDILVINLRVYSFCNLVSVQYFTSTLSTCIISLFLCLRCRCLSTIFRAHLSLEFSSQFNYPAYVL